MSSTVASPSPAMVIPQRETHRRVNTVPLPPEDLDARKRRFMYAPFLDVKLSRRHEAKWAGINVFHQCEIESINEIQTRPVRPALDQNVNFPTPRIGTGRRLPRPIADTLAAKYAYEEGGVATLILLDSIKDCSEEQVDLYQFLVFPVIDVGYGGIHRRLEHLHRIVDTPLANIANECRALTRSLVTGGYAQQQVYAKIKEAVEMVEAGALDAQLAGLLKEVTAGMELALQRARYHADSLISEMDDKARGDSGKPKPDQFDRKIFWLLGEETPRITSNVKQGAQAAYASTAPVGGTKTCIVCFTAIDLRARKCPSCREWQTEEDARAAAARDAEPAETAAPADDVEFDIDAVMPDEKLDGEQVLVQAAVPVEVDVDPKLSSAFEQIVADSAKESAEPETEGDAGTDDPPSRPTRRRG